MTYPSASPRAPGVVLQIAGGRPTRAVWLNELGGVTFRIDGGEHGTEYVKTGPGEFAAEAGRLTWAGAYALVPTVLGFGADWLHTAGLTGESRPDSASPETAPAVVAATASIEASWTSTMSRA